MRQMRKVVSLGMLSLVFILPAYGMGGRPVHTKMKPTILPTIVVALGDHIDQIKARSTMSMDSEHLSDDDILVAQEPNSFIYNHSQRGFTLPEARYVAISMTLGVVTDLRISPQIEYFNIDQAFKMCTTLIELIDRAGWERDRAFYKSNESLEDLRREFEAKTSRPGQGARIEGWKNNDDELYVTLERKHKVGQPHADSLGYKEDKYLITIFISNARLSKEQYQKMFKQREQDGYTENDWGPRPLSTVGKKKQENK